MIRHILMAVSSWALATLVFIQTDETGTPLMADYHGLIIIWVGLILMGTIHSWSLLEDWLDLRKDTWS